MAIRFLMIAVFAFLLSGCATTSKTSPVNQLQIQVTEMQQRMEDQEKEIVDLKYEVKELAGSVAEQEPEDVTVIALDETAKMSAPVSLEPKNLDIIRVGITGRELQKALKVAGFYTGKLDGKVGPKTKAAVVDFQKSHGLTADGIVGQKTWSELKVYIAPAAASTDTAAQE